MATFISSIIGVIGTIFDVVGIVAWFNSNSTLFLFIGLGLYIIETILEWNNLNANAKKINIWIFAIGCLAGWAFSSAPWYVGGLIALCGYSAITAILGWAGLLLLLK